MCVVYPGDPGIGLVVAACLPLRMFIIVDLPTLGYPTIAATTGFLGTDF